MCHAPVPAVPTDHIRCLALHLQSDLGCVHGECPWGQVREESYHVLKYLPGFTNAQRLSHEVHTSLPISAVSEAMPPNMNGLRALMSTVTVYILMTVILCGGGGGRHRRKV